MVVFQIVGIANTQPVYDAHFAISDLDRGDFHFKKQVTMGQLTNSTDRFDLDVAGFQMGRSMGTYYAKASPPDMDYSRSPEPPGTTTNGPTAFLGGQQRMDSWFSVSLDDNSQYNISFFMKGDGTVD